jgi:hypothetical protein
MAPTSPSSQLALCSRLWTSWKLHTWAQLLHAEWKQLSQAVTLRSEVKSV